MILIDQSLVLLLGDHLIGGGPTLSVHLSVNWGIQRNAGLPLSLSNHHCPLSLSLSNYYHWRGNHLPWIDDLSAGYGHCLHQAFPFVEATS